MLSIVLVYFKSPGDIDNCIDSITRCEPDRESYEIVVVDNASGGADLDRFEKKYDFVRIVHAERNGGFAYGCNIGIRSSHGDCILLLNPDTYVADNAIGKLYARLRGDSRISFIGPRLLNPDGTDQSSIHPKSPLTPWKAVCESLFLQNLFPWSRLFNSYKRVSMDLTKESFVGQLSGAALMFRRSVVAEIGLLDEKHFMYFEEADYCLRAVRRGLKLLYFPQSTVIHRGGSNASDAWPVYARYYIEGMRRFLKAHYGHCCAEYALCAVAIGAVLRIALYAITGNKRLKYQMYCLKYLLQCPL